MNNKKYFMIYTIFFKLINVREKKSFTLESFVNCLFSISKNRSKIL